MITPPVPPNDEHRVEALKSYAILDTNPEADYDNVTALASSICETPIALISLVDKDRQWSKSCHGMAVSDIPREITLCTHAIDNNELPLEIDDTRIDERFCDNPLVNGNPPIIFYVGIPLINEEGYALGTLCVIDHKPKKLSGQQLFCLKALANQLMKLLELRRTNINLRITNKNLENQNKGLRDFAQVAAHDLKSPLNNIVMLSELLNIKHSQKLNMEGKGLLTDISYSSKKLTGLIDGILEYSQSTNLLLRKRHNVALPKMMEEIIHLVDPTGEAIITPSNVPESFFTNKIALEQILINLLSNAIKYNNKSVCRVWVLFEVSKEFMTISVKDNGPGIAKPNQDRIFELFETTANTDKNCQKGTGIGLATVKTLVEGMGGKISVHSEMGKGSIFKFYISSK